MMISALSHACSWIFCNNISVKCKFWLSFSQNELLKKKWMVSIIDWHISRYIIDRDIVSNESWKKNLIHFCDVYFLMYFFVFYFHIFACISISYLPTLASMDHNFMSYFQRHFIVVVLSSVRGVHNKGICGYYRYHIQVQLCNILNCFYILTWD